MPTDQKHFGPRINTIRHGGQVGREFNNQDQNLPPRHPPRRAGWRHGEMLEQEKQKQKQNQNPEH
jgi:hypothetical protein